MKTNKNFVQIPSLTGLRFLAVLMVYFFHFNPWKDIPILGAMVNQLYIGVNLFFVLSGFLITYNFISKGYQSISQYYWFRFTRIYPLFFTLTLFTYLFPAFYFNKFDTLFTIKTLADFTLIKAYFDDFLFAGIAQGWTLTVEMTFYLLIPFLIILWEKLKFPFLIITLLILSFGTVFKVLGNFFLPYSFIPSWEYFFQVTFFGRYFEFLTGMAIAFSFQKFKKIPHLTWIGLFFIILSIYLLKKFSPTTSEHGIDSAIGLLISNIFLPLFGIAPLLLGLLHERSFLQQLFATNFLQLLGKSSYAFYLIHMGIIQSYLFYALKLDPYSSLLILYILAIALYFWFEKPVMIWLRKRIIFREIKNQDA